MKKLAYVLTSALILVNFTACSGSQPESPNSQDIGGTTSLEAPVILTPNSSEISDNPEISAFGIPKGEPTFLTCPDGTAIYVSEITEIYTGDEEWGTKEAITLEQAEQFAQDGGDFTVKCGGFFYGYIPERSLNHVDDPEMFKQDENYGEYYDYLGEEFNTNECEGKFSTEYSRIKVGDKFGPLTVKSAYTLFADKYWRDGDYSDIPGTYIADCEVEFDGEAELTGYVAVTKMDAHYGKGGDMEFFPDGESSIKIPGSSYFTNRKAGKMCHFYNSHGYGFLGDWTLDLGNMYEVNCDTSGLQPGDYFVKVKVVLDNIKYVSGDFGGLKVELKNIEVL